LPTHKKEKRKAYLHCTHCQAAHADTQTKPCQRVQYPTHKINGDGLQRHIKKNLSNQKLVQFGKLQTLSGQIVLRKINL
jgi:hypothetical protein